MKITIGLTGEKGSGKETSRKFLEEKLGYKYTFECHRFSDVLTETLKLWHLPVTRENLQVLAQKMREAYGPDVLANVVEKRVLTSRADIVILDGLRWKASDPQILRRLPNNHLVYITAPVETRFHRCKLRGEKAGERDMTFEDFLRTEAAPNEIEIPELGRLADFKIDNSGTFEELRAQIHRFITEKINIQ